ncbi:MAG: isoleucine--tRNA ligase [Planctomycetes bacterium]|nr:isoleucine--tRNA ligase [Planctomycetota bacterium]
METRRPMTREATYRSFPEDYLSAPDRAEQAVLEFWNSALVFGEQQKRRIGAKPFIFYEGPPTANGKPGIHHVFARAIKDAVCRYHWMRGARVERKAGWDTHGLPVELEIEKKLGISGKKQIEEIAGTKEASIAKFNDLCKESVFTYLKEWRSLSERMGYWLDYDHPYITFDPGYIESVWWLISRFHANGLLEKRFKVIPYCPRCGTGLSSHEVGQGYKDVQDPSVTVKFRLQDDPATSLLVWTTTPWTLPSNAGAAVNPELEYVKIRSPKHAGEQFWIAKARMAAVAPDAEVIESKRGRELAGIRYIPPFENLTNIPDLRAKPRPEAAAALHTIRAGEFVSSEEGTGIVHMAPCYGADDYELGEREGLPIYAAVGRDGKLAIDVGRAARGTFFKDADAGLMAELKDHGKLFARTTVQHTYPFCWRCDTPLLYYASPSWFLKTTAYRDAMVENNKKIRWAPPEIGAGRFGEWLEGNVDWAISRDRYWGTPLPVWECEYCNHFEVIDSIATLRKRAKSPFAEPFDPHKPGIDNIIIECAKCKKDAKRSLSVIDCWFDSGAMPFAQNGFPYKPDSGARLADQFPAHFIAEGLDQTRGWFYTLHAIATFISCYDRQPGRAGERVPSLSAASSYRSCVVNGLVLDAQGRKMSKRLGNAVNPFEAMQQNGADAVRLLLLGSGALHLNRRFDPDSMTAMRRQVVIPLVNCLQFFATYANEANYNDNDFRRDPKSRTLLDRWIRSRAETLAKSVADAFDNYDLPAAIAALSNFADSECSNWYVRRNRKRFQSGDLNDRWIGLETLRHVLGIAARCLAPIAPFAAEMLWHRIHRRDAKSESVHLQQFPTLDAGFGGDMDAALDSAMGSALTVARLARAIREKNKIRNTIPLPWIYLLVPRLEAGAGSFMSAVEDIVKDEVNVDEVRFEFYPPTPGQEHYFHLKAKPNFPVLGKRAGKLMKSIQEAILKLDDAQVIEFMAAGRRLVAVEGGAFEIGTDDVIVAAEVEDSACESDSKITVGLNVKYNDSAIARACAREFASAVNQARRDANFKLSDRCRVELAQSEAASRVLSGIGEGSGRQRWLDDLRATSIATRPADKHADWRETELIDGEKVAFRVARDE